MKQREDSDTGIKKKIYKLLIMLLGVLFWISAIFNQKRIADFHGSVSVRFSDSAVTKEQIENALESMLSRKDADIPKVTLWQREEKTPVTNVGMGKSLNVDWITVAGDMSKVYPGPVIQGGYLSGKDYGGCVIDKNSAYRLFGSENVIGLKLQHQDKDYIIRGILESADSNVMIVQADGHGFQRNNKMYHCMELEFTDHQNALAAAKNFVLTYGLGKPSAYINGYQYQKLAELLIHVPIWLYALWIIRLLVRKVHSWRSSLILTLTGYLTVLAFIMILIKLAALQLYFPGSLIPNKWSDFDFWTVKWKEMTTSLLGREGIVRYYKEIVLKNRLIFVTAGVAVTVMAERIMIKDFTNKIEKIHGFLKQ